MTAWSGGYRTEFVYDGLGRLRKRIEYNVDFPSGNWSSVSETRYVYDGMRVIQERNSSNTPLVSYTRGSDLSGSLEGGGGIGGLLARSHGYASTNGNWYTHNCYHADGNGNITYLVNSSQGLAASYRYDPFGNTISSSGSLASVNVYRFSSKELYDFYSLVSLYYYGYRWYVPNLQRWLNRDPIMENGGLNLYTFVENQPVSRMDAFGLDGGINDPGVERDCPLPPIVFTSTYTNITQKKADELNRDFINTRAFKRAETMALFAALTRMVGVPGWFAWGTVAAIGVSAPPYTGRFFHPGDNVVFTTSFEDNEFTDERTKVTRTITVNGEPFP